MDVKQAIATLRLGIKTTLDSAVPSEQMVAAVDFLEAQSAANSPAEYSPPNNASPKLPGWVDLWNEYVARHMASNGMQLPAPGARDAANWVYESIARQLRA